MAPTATVVSVPYLFGAILVLAGAATSDRPPQPNGRRLRAVVEDDDALGLIQSKVKVGQDVTAIGSKQALAEASSANHAAAAAKQSDLPSGWFGDFSQDESTFSKEGSAASRDDPQWAVKYGRDPNLETEYQNFEVLPSKFFHESQSGGAKAAWQTNDPSLEASVAGNRVKENPWSRVAGTPSGWVQDYQTTPDGGAVNPSSADWFDNSVHQVDGFGRKMEPSLDDGARLLATGWQEKSVNTTLSCKAIGCNASSSLQLYDPKTQEAKLCSLSIDIHATDYDDDFSREHVEFWKVNGYIATRECNPRARGCNATAERPLYPCLNGFNVDHIINTAGTLLIEGQNSKMVDECPYKGNLLSGVAMATCMVRNKNTNTTNGNGNDIQMVAKPPAVLFTQSDLFSKAVLKCDTPGCSAEATVHISPAIALNGGKCTMNVSVHQTDFDHNLGLPEQIDFIQVEGVNISTAPIQPGKNPCNSEYKGTNVTVADKIFSAIQSYDITHLVTKSDFLGMLKVKGKISDQVDECAFEGHLLNGNVTVQCVPPAKYSAAPPASQAAFLHAPKDEDKAPSFLQGSAQKHLLA